MLLNRLAFGRVRLRGIGRKDSSRAHAVNKKLYIEPLKSDILDAVHITDGVAGIILRKNSPTCHATCSPMRNNTFHSAKLKSLIIHEGTITEVSSGEMRTRGRHIFIRDATDLQALEADIRSRDTDEDELLMMEASSGSWSIIPAENIIAAVSRGRESSSPSPSPCLLMVVDSAEEGRLMLEALQIGVDGIVLRTAGLQEVKDMLSWMRSMDSASRDESTLPLELVTVTKIQLLGSGDRACIDLSSLMFPGEGLLVGSFCRGLFLVHSECSENDFIASRPFRVNAGPVHSYVHKNSQAETAYLSELQSGTDMVIVDAKTRRMRPSIVGRVKIESRPLVLVEAISSGGSVISIQLQNAETVQLVTQSSSGDVTPISVKELKVGDKVLALVNEGVARHTGIAIKEFLKEI
jgi:3-dehydroquinate synthase class II